jgi:hypothetical protein
MKKFVFAALAAVFIISSGFAATTNSEFATSLLLEDGGMCRYGVTRSYIDEQRRMRQETKYYSFYAEDRTECESRAGMHAELLNAGISKW